LAETMPRPEAQAATKALCAQAQDSGMTLGELALQAYPDLPKSVFNVADQMGQAPNIARAFAAQVSKI
jgi:3-carboxy-cis,cis-muconate cycloisomerase